MSTGTISLKDAPVGYDKVFAESVDTLRLHTFCLNLRASMQERMYIAPAEALLFWVHLYLQPYGTHTHRVLGAWVPVWESHQ